MTTPAQIQAAKARFQLGEGSNLLRSGPSRFGRPGLLARAAALRATRPLGMREALVDERLLGGLEALAIDTSVGHRGASSFPDPLTPDGVTDVASDVGRLFMHDDDHVMTPFISQHGFWEASETRFLRARLPQARRWSTSERTSATSRSFAPSSWGLPAASSRSSRSRATCHSSRRICGAAGATTPWSFRSRRTVTAAFCR